jgi:hypothetical protein
LEQFRLLLGRHADSRSLLAAWFTDESPALRSCIIDGEGALARRLARAQITREPLCRACLARGKVEPATCADHITPHAGNVNVFFLSPLQRCHACHALKTA